MTEAGGVAIFEARIGGHRLAYVRLLVQAAIQVGIRPWLLLPAGVAEMESYQEFLGDLDGWDLLEFDIRGNSAMEEWRALRSMAPALKSKGISRVLVPSGDRLAKARGFSRLWGRAGFAGLEMVAGLLKLECAYPERGWWQSLLDRAAFALQRFSGARLLCYDRYACTKVKGVDYVPDPYLAPPQGIRENRGMGSLRMGSVGRLGARRGIDRLVKAFAQAGLQDGTILALRGKVVDKETQAAIESVRDALGERMQLELEEGFLEESDFHSFMMGLDVVALPYGTHIGPSGVFAQAAALGKVVVVDALGWMGREAGRYPRSVLAGAGTAGLAAALKEAERTYRDLVNRPANYEVGSPREFSGAFLESPTR